MKHFFPRCFLTLAILATPVLAQQPGKIATVSRSVMLFSNLENQLNAAVHDRKSAVLEKLLAPNFEQRDQTSPGKPLPRVDWMRNALAKPKVDAEPSQMAVHDYGNIAVVSFLDAAQHEFIVDVWSKAADGYVLSVRYASASGGTATVPATKPDDPAK